MSIIQVIKHSLVLFGARRRLSHPQVLKHLRNQSTEFSENFKKILNNLSFQISISIFAFLKGHHASFAHIYQNLFKVI